MVANKVDKQKKKVGRKPSGDKPLTSAEKMQRQRVKRELWNESAKDSDYTTMPILINNRHILAFNELAGEILEPFDTETLSIFLFEAAQLYLEQEKFGLEAPKRDDWPKHCRAISMISLNAKLKFSEWERNQINENSNSNEQ